MNLQDILQYLNFRDIFILDECDKILGLVFFDTLAFADIITRQDFR